MGRMPLGFVVKPLAMAPLGSFYLFSSVSSPGFFIILWEGIKIFKQMELQNASKDSNHHSMAA